MSASILQITHVMNVQNTSRICKVYTLIEGRRAASIRPRGGERECAA